MVLQLVKCPHCGFKFRMDTIKLMDDGKTVVVRSILKFRKQKPISLPKVDIVCLECKMTFEHEVLS